MRASGFDLPDADIRYWRRAFASDEADSLFAILRATTAWEAENIVVFGQRHLAPRLVAWHGDENASYTYSGTYHEPRAWTPELLGIRTRICDLTGHTFNSVLLNLYRDGRDGMGWHADDERELGLNPLIASVSLGAARRFKLRHRVNKDAALTLDLEHGSLLLMSGATQHHYVHSVPKTARVVAERINLTYRCVLDSSLVNL